MWKHPIPSGGRAPNYTHLLTGISGPILEPAAGTGRILIPLLALACFRDSLVPGGRLVVDIPVSQPATGPGAIRYWRRDPYLWTRQTIHIEHDPAADQTTHFLRYDKWQDGTLRMTELQTFRLQHWSIQDFEDLVVEAGFTNTLVTADYQDAGPPGAGKDVWTCQATTPPARTASRTRRA